MSNAQAMPSEENPGQIFSLQPRFRDFLTDIDIHAGYSQWGEESIIQAIFDRIGETNRWCCEIGAGDGLFLSNTRALIEKEWRGVFAEKDEGKFADMVTLYPGVSGFGGDSGNIPFVKANASWLYLTKVVSAGESSICALLDDCGAPRDIDLLSIDVDGQDYYLLNSLLQFHPRVIVCEYNPETNPDFVPLLDGVGQAGLHAIISCGMAKCYTPVVATYNNVIFVHNCLAARLAGEPEIALQREQMFAAGKWQDIGEGCTVEAYADETEKAAQGLLPRRFIEGERRAVRVSVALSTPRIGFLDSSDCLADAAASVAAPRFRGYGISWFVGLTRSLTAALEWFDPASGEVADFILTADYDSYCVPPDLHEMIKILAQNPEVDCLVPMQMKRGTPHGKHELLCRTAGPANMTNALVPIIRGHFGFTLFRREFFEGLDKPWFKDIPDEEGEWGDGRVDADIYFWDQAIEKGKSVALSTKVLIGHGEEVIAWPIVIGGRIEKYYQPINSWMDGEKRPPHVGVINTPQWPARWPGLAGDPLIFEEK